MNRNFIDELDRFRERIRGGRSVNVNDRETKDAIVAIASRYFKSVRDALCLPGTSDGALKHHDEKWQELLRLAHGNNGRKTYVRVLGQLKRELSEFSVVSLSHKLERGVNGGELSDLTPAEQLIIDTLDRSISSASASYRQGVLDLRGVLRLSYRGTAAEFREALRETLDHLAPDSDVTSQGDFKYEDDQKKPTMKQKVRFVLKKRGWNKTRLSATEHSVSLIENLVGDVMRAVYARASLAIHLETSRREVLQVKRYVDVVLFDLLEISGAVSLR